ncbi:MAG: ParB/RepB/Spo0J family partition protein [Anaerolineaceae bacterium]|nr:ParB/RepB/Spo0J family partition protein [Anaerolineaceae bacterium]
MAQGKKGFNIGSDIFEEAMQDATTVEKSISSRPKRSFALVAIKDIIEDSPNQKRITTFDSENISEDAELLVSVKAHGVVEPIIVKRLPGKLGAGAQYLLVAGHRRKSAAQLAGLEYIPTLIITNEDNVSILTLAENTGTRKLTSYELAMSIEQIAKENPDWDTKTIIAKTGVPQSTVYNLLNILNDDCPAIIILLQKGVGSRHILELKQVISSIENDDEQFRLADLIDNSITFTQIKSFRTKVDSGIEPFLAFNLTMGGNNNDPSLSYADENDGAEVGKAEYDSGKKVATKFNDTKNKKPLEKDTAKNNKTDTLPDLENKHAIVSLAQINGLSLQTTKSLLSTAKENGNGTTLHEFTFACMFVKIGKDRNKALELARVVSGNNKLGKLLLSHQELCIQAQGFLDNGNQDKEIAELLEKVILAGRISE